MKAKWIAVFILSMVTAGCMARRPRTEVQNPNRGALLPTLSVGDSDNHLPPRAGSRVADHRVGVQLEYPGEFMFVTSSGAKAAFSARELERIARDYIAEKSVPFDTQGTEMNIWIDTSGGPVIARVDFSSGIGRPCLMIEIDKDGIVKRHVIAVAVCGFGD